MNAPTPLHTFWPDAEHDPAADRLRRRTRRAFIMIAVLVIGCFGLAAVLNVGGAVVGSGEVAVESSVKTIAHPTGGILTAVLVRDGDHVAAGQVLMKFDVGVSSVGMESAALGLEQLRARRARLEAERDGAGSILFPPELTRSTDPKARDAMQREQRLFGLRQRERSGTIALLGQRVRQYQEQIGSYDAQIAAYDQQMVLVEPELAGLRKLHDKQLVTINRLNEMERTGSRCVDPRRRCNRTSPRRARVSRRRASRCSTSTSKSEATPRPSSPRSSACSTNRKCASRPPAIRSTAA